MGAAVVQGLAGNIINPPWEWYACDYRSGHVTHHFSSSRVYACLVITRLPGSRLISGQCLTTIVLQYYSRHLFYPPDHLPQVDVFIVAAAGSLLMN